MSLLLFIAARVSPPPSTDIKDFSRVFLEMLSAIDMVPFEKLLFSKYPAGPFHRTVLWNGPAGYFENKNFLNGTMSIAEAISKNTNDKSLISVIGGGDTLAAINKSKNKLSFSHLSTAGGAFLEFLEGKDLPGLSVLK